MGITLDDLYAGESMFALAPNASKVAFVWLVCQMKQWGIGLIDCQVYTDHLSRFGAKRFLVKKIFGLFTFFDVSTTEAQKWSFDKEFKPF